MRRSVLALACLLAAGCRGEAPVRYGPSSLGFSAILVGARIIIPTGETKDGYVAMNLESSDERYRFNFTPGPATLLRMEPGLYRLSPTRNVFGFVQSQLRAHISGRTYRVPFPRDILRMDPIELRPTKIVSVGVLEVRLYPIVKGQPRRMDVKLDNSIVTRRHLIEEMIEKMMDPKSSSDVRDSAVSWTRALEQALVRIQGEEQRSPIYKPSQ